MESNDPPLYRYGFDANPYSMVQPYLELIRTLYPIDRQLSRIARNVIERSTPGLPFAATKVMAQSSDREERHNAANRLILLYEQDPVYFTEVAHQLLEDDPHVSFEAGDTLLFMANMGILPIDDFLSFQDAHPHVEWLDDPKFD